MPGINPLVATPLRNVRTAWSPQPNIQPKSLQLSMTTVLEKWCEFFTHFPFFRCIGHSNVIGTRGIVFSNLHYLRPLVSECGSEPPQIKVSNNIW